MPNERMVSFLKARSGDQRDGESARELLRGGVIPCDLDAKSVKEFRQRKCELLR